jgi:hypothetical protein
LGLWEFLNEKWYIVLNGIIALVLLAIYRNDVASFLQDNFILLIFIGAILAFMYFMKAGEEEQIRDPQKLLEYACHQYKSLRKLGINPHEKFNDMVMEYIDGKTKIWIYEFQQNSKKFTLFINAKNGMPLKQGEAKHFSSKVLNIQKNKDPAEGINYFEDSVPATPSQQSPPPQLQEMKDKQQQNPESFYLDEPKNTTGAK